MATDTQIKTHKFYSRGRNERIIRQPLVREVSSLGSQRVVQNPVRYEFGPDGWLELYEGKDLLADGPIDPDTLEPTVQDAVTYLRSHPKFNVRIWEQGREPDRPLPTEEDFLAVVTRASAQLDPEPIQEVLAQERESHNRSVLLSAAEGALRTIAETRAALEREQQQKQRQEQAQPAGGED